MSAGNRLHSTAATRNWKAQHRKYVFTEQIPKMNLWKTDCSVMWVKTGVTGDWGIVPTLKLFLCLSSTGSRWVSTHHLLRLVLAQISVTDECRRAEDNGGQHFPPLSAVQRWAKIKRTAQLFSLNASDNLSISTLLIKSACCKMFRLTRLFTGCRDAPLAT